MNIPALREIVEERKQKAIVELSESYAKNRLPLEEYERLVEYINKIESERELVVVEKIVAEYKTEEKQEMPERQMDDYEEDSYVDERSGFDGGATILSSRSVSGPLKSGSQFFNLLGSTRIRIRKSDLAKRRTSLNIVNILGDAVIYVESGIHVNNKAIPVLGSARIDSKVKKDGRDGTLELNITGVVLLGDIKVKLLKD